jgi:hypothetical protein
MRQHRSLGYTAFAIFWGALLLFLFPGYALSETHQNKTGIIAGKLINKTEPGGSVSDVEVLLRHFIGERESEQKKTKTGSNGNFQFYNLSTGTGESYLLKAFYRGAEYSSKRIAFKKDQSRIDLQMVVFDSTDNDEYIDINAYHMFVDVQQNILFVQEVIIVGNSRDRTYIGKREISPGTRETFKISLHKGASNLQYFQGLMSCCVQRTKDGLVDTLSIMPGTKQFAFSYQSNFDSSKFDVRKAIYFDTKNISILTPVSGIQVLSSQLSKGKVVSFGEKKFMSYSGQNFQKGTTLSFSFSNLPVKKTYFLWLILGLAVIAVLAVILIPTILRRRAGPPITEEEESDDEVKKLLVKIARLDEIFEEGLISEKSYEEERNRAKEALQKLKETEKSDEDE